MIRTHLALRSCAPLLLAAFVAACTGDEGSEINRGSIRITGSNSDGGQFELTVVDEGHLVAAAASRTRPDGLPDEGAQLEGDGRTALVWWPGIPCEANPTITVTGTSDRVLFEVDDGPQRAGACSMNEVQLTIRLSLREPFSSAEMTRSP